MTQGFNEQSVLSDVLLPASLQQYQLKGLVAQENVGQIFAAWDTQLCRDVWIRRIHHHGEYAAQILNEARLAAALKHPAFTKIHALEESDGYLFVIGEAILGLSLLEWVGQNPGNQKAIFDLTVQIASALAEAHQVGLVHGDIHAKQFIIDASRQVRILNCGFARDGSPTVLSSIDQIDGSGGLAYFAPERFADSTATPASDVYALGILLYQMLNGSLPFVHLQGLAMVAAMVQADAEKWPCRDEVSPALREWMLAMLKRQPEQRISCLEIVEQGRVIREAEGYSATNSSINLQGLQGQLAELAHRKRRNYVLSVVLVLLLIAGGVWQAQPDWPRIVEAITPYSEAREMSQGEEALSLNALKANSEQLEKADDHFARVLAHKPDHARAVAFMALVYLAKYGTEKKDEIFLQKAKASVQQAMRLNNEDGVVLIANAKVLQWHHQLDAALDSVTRGLQSEPNNLIGWQVKMSILLEQDKKTEAIEFAALGAKKFPEDYYMLNLKGSIDLQVKNYKGAKEAFTESLARQPDSSTTYALLAQALEGLGEYDAALQTLQQGLQVRPNAYLYATLGRAKFERREYEQAVVAFSHAASLEKGVSGSYVRWLDLAESLMWVPGRKEEALQAFSQSQHLLEIRLKRSPDDSWLLAHMSFILARLGENEQSKKYAKNVVDTDTQDYYRLYIVSQSFELVGMREEAIKTLRRAQVVGLPDRLVEKNPIFDSLRKDARYQSH